MLKKPPPIDYDSCNSMYSCARIYVSIRSFLEQLQDKPYVVLREYQKLINIIKMNTKNGDEQTYLKTFHESVSDIEKCAVRYLKQCIKTLELV